MRVWIGLAAFMALFAALALLWMPACAKVPEHSKPDRKHEASAAANDDAAHAITPEEKAYSETVRESLREHARALAKRGDARSLLAATLIYPNPFPVDSNVYGTPVPAEARAWFDEARRLDPNDPLIAWLDATNCTLLSLVCNRNEASRHVVQLEPHNAAAHALAASVAYEGQDTATGRAELSMAARSTLYDTHARDTLGLLHSALHDWSSPAIPETVRRQQEASRKPEQDWSANNPGDVQAHALVVSLFVQIPPVQCWVNHLPTTDDALRHDCIAISKHRAEADDTLVGQLTSLSFLVRLRTDENALHWREQYLRLQWLVAQYEKLMEDESKKPKPDRLIDVDATLREGEVEIMRNLLRSHDMAVEPPVGWLPDDERNRSLILTGRLSTKK